MIEYYHIEVTEILTGQVATNHTINDHIRVPARPGKDYNCRVAAFTVGLGPFTDYFTVTSQESGINSVWLY